MHSILAKVASKPCYIMGDYNLDLLKHEIHHPADNFLDIMYANYFIPLINRPTRITRESSTLIDNIFSNNHNVNDHQVNGILKTDLTDHYIIFHTLTLSQRSSSGNPGAIQCAWNLDPSVDWNATGERITGSQCPSSGLPVAFQSSSSVFQLGKLTLGHHWVLASASVVPVASQRTCGSSGLPVCSDNAILVTADVQSLYTNIQPNKGLEALRKMYDKYDVSMPFEEINRLLELSLLHNDFLFNDQWFLQTSSTAMGKQYAPSFANIFMANLEDEVLRKAKCKPLAMLRFIDDIFFIWNHSRDELTEFINLFNSHDDSIKIDCNINETSVDFLDVTIFKGSGFSNHNILDIKVYFKETDTHELLHKKSFHPKHTFEGILKLQLIRFLTICNNMEDFHEATSILFKVLREKRHYSGRFLRQVTARFLRNYRQPGNTLDPIGAALKCKSRRCQCCLYLDEKSHFNNDDFDFPIFGGLKSSIYIIECKACGDKYLGETGRCLKDRMFNHISDIRRNKNGPVSRHFNNADNICFGAEYNMILYPIEQIPDQGNAQKNKSLRLKRELHWIKTLWTQFPHGMNHKIVRKRDIFITFPFSNNARKAFKITKDIYTKLQKMHPNVFKGELMCSFKRNKNLGDYLVSAKLK